jgi:hypothetical protein
VWGMSNYRSRKCGEGRPTQSQLARMVNRDTTALKTWRQIVEEVNQTAHLEDSYKRAHHEADRQCDSGEGSERGTLG